MRRANDWVRAAMVSCLVGATAVLSGCQTYSPRAQGAADDNYHFDGSLVYPDDQLKPGFRDATRLCNASLDQIQNDRNEWRDVVHESLNRAAQYNGSLIGSQYYGYEEQSVRESVNIMKEKFYGCMNDRGYRSVVLKGSAFH
jgi:hypothetical protein